MRHPSIAKMFDAGATEEGRPCFVTGYVAREPVTEYCDGRRPGTRERLLLLVKIGAGVQHVHQNPVTRDRSPTSEANGNTSTDLHRCVRPGGTLLSCNPAVDAIIRTVSTNCVEAPCCTAQPFACVCPNFPCPGGTSLAWRTDPLP
jgi:hypothetical protein